MYSNIKWQISTMQNGNYFCTNLTAGHMVSVLVILLCNKFPPQNLATGGKNIYFILLKTSWVSNLGKTQQFCLGVFQCLHLGIIWGCNQLRTGLNLWLHKEIPHSILVVKGHHDSNLMQKDFICSERNETEWTKN